MKNYSEGKLSSIKKIYHDSKNYLLSKSIPASFCNI